MKTTRFNAITRWVWPMLLLIALGLGWEIAVRLTETPRWMLPPPSAVFTSFYEDWSLLMQHTRVTLVEVLIGFVLALVAGIATGVAIDSSRIIERAVYPLLIASQTIPMVVLAPLFLIWFGYGLLPKVLITALVAYFPLAVNTVDGLRSGDREILALLRSMGASRWQRFRLAKVPAALPSIFSGARIAVAFCVIGAVFGELVGAKEGLGYLMERAASQFETARVFAAIFILAFMGVGLFVAVTLLEHLLLPWRRYITDGSRGN
ncbi:MAG TPA: ABC transporter permease [Thermomicrobiales bacterium]|nr:ABC transporter permease [Thermomicrobiales bacterium]